MKSAPNSLKSFSIYLSLNANATNGNFPPDALGPASPLGGNANARIIFSYHLPILAPLALTLLQLLLQHDRLL